MFGTKISSSFKSSFPQQIHGKAMHHNATALSSGWRDCLHPGDDFLVRKFSPMVVTHWSAGCTPSLATHIMTLLIRKTSGILCVSVCFVS